MTAMRTPCAALSTTLLTLALMCAFAACSRPVPPEGSNRRPAAAAPTPVTPVATAPPIEPGSGSTRAEVPAPSTPSTPATAAPPAAIHETPPPPVSEPEPAPAPAPAASGKAPGRPVRPVGTRPTAQDESPASLTIEALSRGKGVPAETREAFKRIRALVEQRQATAAVAGVQQQRIGLEGESRLCVDFRNASDAQAALAEIRKIATDVELLTVAESPCPSNKESAP